MLYNKIDKDLISISDKQNNVGEGALIDIYYDGGILQISEKNKYVVIDGINISKYNKKQVKIKSKVLSTMIDDIISSINDKFNIAITTPIYDGYIIINVNDSTRIVDIKNRKTINEDISSKVIHACISITIPSLFKMKTKATLQLHANEIVVSDIRDNNLEIDVSKLKLAD